METCLSVDCYRSAMTVVPSCVKDAVLVESEPVEKNATEVKGFDWDNEVPNAISLTHSFLSSGAFLDLT